MATKTELDAAYRATTYRVFLPEGVVELRIDSVSSDFAAWLKAKGVNTWAIVTAANPGSQQISIRENAEHQAKLECELLEAGFEPFVVEAVADDGQWPVEESCLVPGIDPSKVIALARQFGQNAVLLGESDGVPRLAWTEEYEG